MKNKDAVAYSSPIAKAWTKESSKPANKGRLLLMCSGEAYYTFGVSAEAAAHVMGGEAQKRGKLLLLRIESRNIRAACVKLRAAGLDPAIVGGFHNSPTGHYRAFVDVVTGDRRMSDFMASAGLGITGAGCTEELVLNYSPGEQVDMERVKAGVENMIAIADREKSDFKILSYHVRKLTFIDD